MAKVLSSISGNLISAASAGYAPTNSADVSAIASGYQVVSSTATQLYAGTAFLTSVNGDALSASRAGEAANASMATSAYYDGTGRLISALPDSAAVSSIASSYAESAASGKLDSTAFSTVSGDFLTAETVSSIATSQYGPRPTDVGVTAINGFGLVAKSADTAYSAVYASIALTDNNLRALTSLADSAAVSAIASSYAESAVSGKADSSSLSSYALSSDVSGVIDTVSSNSASWSGVSLPITGSSYDWSVYLDASGLEYRRYGSEWILSATAYLEPEQLYFEGEDGFRTTIARNGIVIKDEHGVYAVEPFDIIRWNSAVDTVSANSATWGQGGVDSATVSSIASSYAESAVSSKLDSSASSSFYTTANESGYVDSAYVDSAVSGKMDTSAIDYTRTGGGTQIYASGTGSSTNQFSAKNDSAGAAIIAGENARLRLWDTAATANLYASSIGGWNAASNLVSSQSANWGGSALALSAGPGVKLEMSGNTLVASTDETVLWSGSGWTVGDTGQTINLSEAPTNFSIVKVYGYRPLPTGSGNYPAIFSDELDMGWLANNSVNQVMLSYAINNTTNQYVGGMGLSGITSTSWKETGGFHYPIGNTKSLGEYAHVHKVIGIGRTAGV